MNRQELIGYVAKGPEVRQVGESKVAVFYVGVSFQEETEWFYIEAWNKYADTLGKWIKKGDMVFIAGRTKTDKWEKDGVNHERKKVVMSEFKILKTKDEQPGFMNK